MAVTDANPESFTRMDESTAEQWAHIGARTFANQGRVADRMIMLLESLAEMYETSGDPRLARQFELLARSSARRHQEDAGGESEEHSSHSSDDGGEAVL